MTLHTAKNLAFSKIKEVYHILSLEVWIFITLSALSFFCLVSFVNLNPVVDDNFFFSSEDPQFQSEHEIDKLFIRKDTQLIIAATGDIYADAYKTKISKLSEILIDIDGVTSVNSLTHFGPKNLSKAMESPLWKRLIVSDDQKSSNIIILLEEKNQSAIVGEVEVILSQFHSDDFRIRTAGLPYVIEQIRRNLTRDLKVFSIMAFVIFGILIFSLFKSKSILIGTLLSCLNACVWTYMLTSLTNIPIGLLTATLGTIIFVMTLSHIIFLTFNWRKADETGKDNPVAFAVKQTFSPSFWSMLTTLLGFLSLTSVPAKPLRDLGTAGIIGSLVAIFVAYGFFPAFLRLTNKHPQKDNIVETSEAFLYQTFYKNKSIITVGIIFSCLLALPGLKMINSDPSLLTYFSEKSEIYKGFKYIDRNGGSSPLILVVRDKNGKPLNTRDAHNKMWKLQDALEYHRSVGSVISLPVLLAEAKTGVGRIIPRELLLKLMESPEYDQVAKSFVTEDRMHGLFLLRMIEEFRTLPRVDIVEEIKSLSTTHGFVPEIVGGVYNLQGHLAKLVSSSLIFGMGKLILFFFIIVWFISRSIKAALGVCFSIVVIPITVFGLIGIYRIPLDIVTAPACNVAIAMGVDSMIHMFKAYREYNNWDRVREEMWRPVVTTMLVICTGFAIFLSSTFPPTQRFGGTILFGSFLAGLIALFFMPVVHEKITKFNFPSIKKPNA